MDTPTRNDLIRRVLELMEKRDIESTTVLRSLYEGTLLPAELDITATHDLQAASHMATETAMTIERLIGSNGEMRTAYEAYRNAIYKLHGIELFEQFANGFALAVQLCVEGFTRQR